MANRAAKRDKTRRNGGETLFGGSSRNNHEPDDGATRCPVPMVQCARRGEPIPASVDAGGVKMKCTNQDCQAIKQLVHPECFEQLETNLIKILGNLGSARGWTEAQKRNNLWEKKGHSLIAKYVRCTCGRGQCSRDTEFYTRLNEEKERAEREEKEAKKRSKKGKQRELPRLNYGNYLATVNSTAPTPQVDMSDLYLRRPVTSPSERSEIPYNGLTSKRNLGKSAAMWAYSNQQDAYYYEEEEEYPLLDAPDPAMQRYDDVEEYPPLGAPNQAKQRYHDEKEYPPLGAPNPTKQRYGDAKGECPPLDASNPTKQRHEDGKEGCPPLYPPDPTKQSEEESVSRPVPPRDKYYTLFGPNSSNFLLGERLLRDLYRNK